LRIRQARKILNAIPPGWRYSRSQMALASRTVARLSRRKYYRRHRRPLLSDFLEKYLSPEPPISMWMLKFQSIIIDKIAASLSMPREIIRPKKDE
jgi:hypothetical protein